MSSANAGFGFSRGRRRRFHLVAQQSRESAHAWSNDPVTDRPGEGAVILRDEETGEAVGPTAAPIQDPGASTGPDGLGYSRFEHASRGIALDLLAYVRPATPSRSRA